MLVQVRKLKKHMQRNFGDDCLLPFCPTDCVYSRTKWRNEVNKKGGLEGKNPFSRQFSVAAGMWAHLFSHMYCMY